MALDAVEPVHGGAQLPRWFDANRVQGHTRLTLGTVWYGKDEFALAGRGFRRLGARAFTRHVKSRDEDPWWPTALPVDDDGRPHSDRPRLINGVTLEPGQNVAGEIIDEAHAEGLKIVAYYWDASEETLALRNTDWICLDSDRQTPITHPRRGTHLDLTGPYREVVLARLLELADMGADGFLFDYRHLPREGCWATALEDAWRAETGEPAPPRPTTKGEQPTPRYLEFLDFRARGIEETFAYWREEVKAVHPRVVFVVSSDDFAGLMDRGVTTRLARIADSAKNEYQQALHEGVTHRVFTTNEKVLAEPPGHVRQSLSWTVLRDSADGRSPHIWHPGVPSADQAEALAASLLTFGAVANMDVHEGSLLDQTDHPGKTPIEGLKRAFALGGLVSPYLARTRALRWAAVHFGERSRSARGFEWLAMWQQVLWPLVGPYKVLTEDGLPVGVVNDDQLEQGDLAGYRLLILPNPDELTFAQTRQLGAFKARGGAVVANEPTWAWSDPTGTDAAAAAFRTALTPHLPTAPLQVSGGPPGRYAVGYQKPGRLIVAVTNDFSWVQSSTIDNPPEETKQRPPPAEGVQVSWRSLRPPRPRAVEAVCDQPLTVQEAADGYRVDLPAFQYMALLVVTEPSSPQRRSR